MADNNTLIKDGAGNQFSLRSRDLLGDGSLRRSMVYATAYPADYGDFGGSFMTRVRATGLPAGIAANAPILDFRFASPSLFCLVRRIRLGFWSLGTGFASGIASFSLYVARNFTIDDTGGLLAAVSSNSGKLRTSMQPSTSTIRYADSAALTAGSRTLDNQPIEGLDVAVPTTTNTQILIRTDLFDAQEEEHPLVLANQEGFIIQATVPATGLWAFGSTIIWDEVTTF
jgi:hypothetical protein